MDTSIAYTLPRGRQRPRLRGLALRLIAGAVAAPMLRLSLWRWPNAAERRCAVAAFNRDGATVPPLLRGLASLPAGRVQMLHALLRHGDDPALAEQLRAALPGSAGAVWLGPKLSVLHLEKTGGHSLLAWLRGHVHPDQIDPDPMRGMPPDRFSAFPPSFAGALDRYPLVWGHYDLPGLRRLGPHRVVLTLLREPGARLVSLYRYWRSLAPEHLGTLAGHEGPLLAHRLSLLDFLRCDEPGLLASTDNLYVRRLTGRYPSGGHTELGGRDVTDALAALQGIDCVGITEELRRSLARFAPRLGIAAPARVAWLNSTDRNHRDNPMHAAAVPVELTPAVREALAARTGLDREVYAAARGRVREG